MYAIYSQMVQKKNMYACIKREIAKDKISGTQYEQQMSLGKGYMIVLVLFWKFFSE